MKTSTNAVECDACGKVIPLILSGSPALQMTLKGQSVGHKKADFCNMACLSNWADDCAAVRDTSLEPAPIPEGAQRTNDVG